MLTRVLDGAHPIEPDLSVREIRAGDRFLLCSDGLSGVVSARNAIRNTRSTIDDPEDAVDALVALALRGGGPDNITCVVADVVDAEERGRATDEQAHRRRGRRSPAQLPSTASCPTRLPAAPPGSLSSRSIRQRRNPAGVSRRESLCSPRLRCWLLGLLLGAGFGWYAWAQQQYYVAHVGHVPTASVVAIYRGPAQQLFGFQLSTVVETSDVGVAQLPEFEQEQVAATIPARSLDGAQRDRRAAGRRGGSAADRRIPPAGCPEAP